MIKPDVRANHLNQNPSERPLIEPLLSEFEVNWARSRTAYNTRVSCYIVDPSFSLREMFGFSSEIALFISPHEKIQPRAIQAITQFLYDEPIRGRVDKSVFMIILKHEKDAEEFEQFYRQAQTGIIPLILIENELKSKTGDKWNLRNLIAKQLFNQDLFDVQLPLKYDYGFFGRESLVYEFSEALSRAQNKGLFGLRKTGKTSLLFKIRRNLEHKNDIDTVYYDCKKPRIRKMRSAEFINTICDDVLSVLGRNTSFANSDEPYSRIEKVFESISEKRTVCIIFDEIEYISYFSGTDAHWKEEFIDFWQTLWSIQSESGKLCFVITGVNAKVVEDDLIDGVQNPLFGIVPSTYLTGLKREEVRNMIEFFGTRMGINFASGAIDALYNRYGGHPLLTRKACSFINAYHQKLREKKPVAVDDRFIAASLNEVDQEVSFYFAHILSGIKEFYKSEYDILEMISSGGRLDAAELIRNGYEVDHLRKYGLISLSPSKAPIISIECLRTYIAAESARAEGRSLPYREIPLDRSASWMKARLVSISKELSLLSELTEVELGRPLFPGHTIGKPDQFFMVEDVKSEADLESFLIGMHQSLVECVERATPPAARSRFFFHDLKLKLPRLQRALLRVRVYRNHFCHADLDGRSLEAFKEICREDFEQDHLPILSLNAMRVLQQLVISELMTAIQEETAIRSP